MHKNTRIERAYREIFNRSRSGQVISAGWLDKDGHIFSIQEIEQFRDSDTAADGPFAENVKRIMIIRLTPKNG